MLQNILKRYTSKDWLLCLGLSVLACFTNIYGDISIYGTISIYVGSIFALLSILLLPRMLSLLVLGSAVTSLYFQLFDIVFVFLQIFEYIIVAMFVRFGRNFLIAVFSFWLLMGLPIVFAIMYCFADFNLQTALFISVTIGLNGVICGITALLIYWFVPNVSQFKRFNPASPKFSNVVFELCIVSVVLPIIFVTLVFTWRSTEEAEKQISKELDSAVMQFENIIAFRMQHNMHAITSVAASIINAGKDANLKTLVNSLTNANSDFESVLITNKLGDVTLIAPKYYADMYPDLSGVNIADREYFKATKSTNAPYISSVFEGRSENQVKIIAVTAPLLLNGEFNGLVQGAIKAESLVNMTAIETVENSNVDIIITDESDAIIYSSQTLGMAAKSNFVVRQADHPFLKQTPVLLVNEEPYIYQQSENMHGWNIFTLASPNKVLASIVDYFLYIAITILLSVLLTALLANKLATKITVPLVNLELFLTRKIEKDALNEELHISRELSAVTASLIKAREFSTNFEAKLQQQVADKTQELELLNQKLYETSQRDALTGLYNRGAFDTLAQHTLATCVRNKVAFALVLIDIDFFKNINDTYGHIVGDKCIIHVANILQDACKRNTDIVARYGGEEYILMLPGVEQDQHARAIDDIRKTIECSPITIDNDTVSLTISCGVVRVISDFSHSYNSLVLQSDEQLYASKRNGRNKITLLDI